MRRFAALLWSLLFYVTSSEAHYNMLLPDKAWADKGDKVTFTYQFGHPFEHELFDAPKPVALLVFNPRGLKENLDIEKKLTFIKKDALDGKKVAAWQFTFTPAERGDYTFFLKTPPIKVDDDATVEDIVRVVLHVQTQNGWDLMHRPFQSGVDIWPYTRPYGLLAGMVFKGRIVRLPFEDEFNSRDLQFVNGLPIEIEKYTEKSPKKLPPDELITFKTKADPQGFFAATLPEAGWWGVTALTHRGPKGMPQQRATMWIHVDEKK